MNEQRKLQRMIETYSFVLYETALYLDTHPHCRAALEYYGKYNARLKEAMEKYESRFGPITIYGNRNCEEWQWVKEPWPWEFNA